MMRNVRLTGALLACFPLTLALSGCGGGVTGDGVGGGGGGEALDVNFDASGGNYAVAEDGEGNQYTFRTREDENGNTEVAEANIKTTDGSTLKASLDDEGRPVNFRMSDNTAADLVYDGDGVDIRFTDSDGSLIEDGQEVNYTLAKARVQARRAQQRSKASPRMQGSSSKAEVLRGGMEEYEEVVESIFDEEENPDSPLATNPRARGMREAGLRLGEIASLFNMREVARNELGDDVTLDEVPEIIRKLAGNTYILFDAEGFCIELTNAANRLTFDNHGILQNEFDRHVIFPDFNMGGSGDPGITINYSTGTPVNLTPGEDVDFDLVVTPVFTGTQMDDQGHITVERRFNADLTFTIELFGATETSAHKLFDAAFLNGTLSDDGRLLEFDLVLIDLQDENPALQLGRLRYHDQNQSAPEMMFACEMMTGETGDSGIACPGTVGEGEDFPVTFMSGREEEMHNLDFDWFISEGFGFIVGDPFAPETMVRATAPGFMEVTLVVSDLSESADTFKVFTCGINVGGEAGHPPPSEGLFLECPPGLNVGEPGFFAVSGSVADRLNYPDWFVFGTSDFFIETPRARETIIEFFHPGKFEVAFQGFDEFNGEEIFASCEVHVGDMGRDECEINGWYGDGECDPFCPRPDPDCGDDFIDFCELNGWYGDGECDEFCPEPDPDCEGEFMDICAENGWYGDGECDLFCPRPDPDCEFFDECAEEQLYGNGVCDPWCPQPDPDCEQFVDVCEENGWYGDGECDEFCPRPDPDCQTVDICAENGWYNDGECDPWCPQPDPDCGGEGGDVCEENGWYGDGECDAFCPRPDPDCDFYDVCAENGWYGDGECDEFCPEPDPDCEVGDICAENGWYGDGVCDDMCPQPDPDCEVGDICAENGWYGDGECDDFCPEPDPDCQSASDVCAENGYYSDYECDDFCPEPDPDCSDECVLNGWYGDGECDDFCPLPDPDCTP